MGLGLTDSMNKSAVVIEKLFEAAGLLLEKEAANCESETTPLRTYSDLDQRPKKLHMLKILIAAGLNASNELIHDIRPLARDLRNCRENWHNPVKRPDELHLAMDWFEYGIHILQCASVYFADETTSLPPACEPQTEALSKLSLSAMRVCGEIGVLLRAGFCEGALARWRTLDEIGIVASLLGNEIPDIASKFLDHRKIKIYELIKNHKKLSSSEGRVFEELKSDVALLKSNYGEEYTGGYGWARTTVKKHLPNFKGPVKMEHLKQCVGLEGWEFDYRRASHKIHATALFLHDYSTSQIQDDKIIDASIGTRAIANSLMSLRLICGAFYRSLVLGEKDLEHGNGFHAKLFLYTETLRKAYDEVSGTDSDTQFLRKE